MRSFPKSLALLACATLSLGLLCASAPAKEDKPADPAKQKAKDPKKKEKSKKDKGKDKPKEEQPPSAGDTKGKLSLPLVEGHDSKGLKIPYFDEAGRLQMIFNIGVATKLDPDNVQMSEMQVETYNEEGEPEMTIEIPTSILNLTTRVVTSHTKTKIAREDFVITGDSVEFNTLTKVGTLVGNVHMIIFDTDDAIPKPTPTPEAPAKPNE